MAKNGSYTIPEGGAIAFRCRVVMHEGDITVAEIERMYLDLARLDCRPTDRRQRPRTPNALCLLCRLRHPLPRRLLVIRWRTR